MNYFFNLITFTRWRLHWMWCRTSNCSSLLIYRSREDERLSWLSEINETVEIWLIMNYLFNVITFSSFSLLWYDPSICQYCSFFSNIDISLYCNHVFNASTWVVQFLIGLGYYYASTEKNRQVYPVWCSRLHNHTLFIEMLCKKSGAPSKF